MPTPSPTSATAAPDSAQSQTVRAQLRLRELVLGGELEPGQRIAEQALVERLGVSRTPIRVALARLQDEGLLAALPGGGFAVNSFSEGDVRDAIELRGTLEGLAARRAAERGVTGRLWADACDAVARIDELLAARELTEASFPIYVEQNGRLHRLLAEMAGSPIIERQIARAATLPFASPNAFVLQRTEGPAARDILVMAQAHHRGVLDAIRQREGARAEALMREHARIAQRNFEDMLHRPAAVGAIPGVSLLRRRVAVAAANPPSPAAIRHR